MVSRRHPSSSESSSSPDSSLGSTKKNTENNTAGFTVQQGHPSSCDWTPLLSLNTICHLDRDRDLKDSPLSDWADYQASDGDPEVTVTEDEGAGLATNQDMEHNPGNSAGAQDLVLGSARPNTEALASAVEMRALTSPALALTMAQIQEAAATGDINGDTNEEKIRLDAYQGVMRGLHMVSCMLSDGYQRACLEVQGLVRQYLNRSTYKDRKFVAEASTALCQWVKAVQLAINCLDKSIAKQSRLLEDARKAGMQITKDILAIYSPEDKKETADPLHDLTA